MPIDESQPSSRPPTDGGTSAQIKLPAPAWTKTAGAPGGVPPMFARANAQAPAARGDVAAH